LMISRRLDCVQQMAKEFPYRIRIGAAT